MELDGVVPDKTIYGAFIKQLIVAGDVITALDLLLKMEEVTYDRGETIETYM